MSTPTPPPHLSLLSSILSKRISNSRLRRLTLAPKCSVDFSSNDFLSLSASPLFRQTFLDELAKNPNHPLASGGSRLLDGNSVYAESLELLISAYHRAESGILFNSGWDANTGLIACVPQPTDVIIYDEFVHASVHEGMRLGRAKERRRFAHNSLSAFREALEWAREETEGREKGSVFIALDAVYSMDGDVAPLREMMDIADEILEIGRALFMVDEAHATGVIGPEGRGLVCALGLEGRVFTRVVTFGKSMACNGAIVLAAPVVREYLVNYARPLIFSTFMAFPLLAAIKASYTLLTTGALVKSQTRVRERTALLHRELKVCGFPPDVLTVVPRAGEDSEHLTPVMGLLTPHPHKLAAFLMKQKLVARPITYPSVPVGGERVRVCVHSGNTEAEILELVKCIKIWVSSLPAKSHL